MPLPHMPFVVMVPKTGTTVLVGGTRVGGVREEMPVEIRGVVVLGVVTTTGGGVVTTAGGGVVTTTGGGVVTTTGGGVVDVVGGAAVVRGVVAMTRGHPHTPYCAWQLSSGAQWSTLSPQKP